MVGQHRALAAQLPWLHRYIISLALDAQEDPFDGMAKLWFDAMAAAYVTGQTWTVDGGVSIKTT